MKKKNLHDHNRQTHRELEQIASIATQGVITVGEVGMTSALMGGMLGSLPK
jgi:hypothetical protein